MLGGRRRGRPVGGVVRMWMWGLGVRVDLDGGRKRNMCVLGFL